MLIVAACSPGADDQDGLTIFAAASLRAVMTDLEAAWLERHEGIPLTVATEASHVLAAQIREGAPADVFISADIERPRLLAGAGLTAAGPVPFARNRITLVVPAGDDRLRVPADLAEPGLRIVAISEGAPIARYADQTLARLAQTMPDPAAFSEAVTANTVSREDNVRAALAKVELGEGDAAFVYLTDALGSELVREVALPQTVSVAADYAAVQVSERTPAADFVAWLGGAEATEVIAAHGFEVVRP